MPRGSTPMADCSDSVSTEFRPGDMRSRPESTDLRSQPTPGMSERPDAPSPRSGRQSAALAAELRGLPGLAAAAAPSAEEGPARVAPSPSPRSRQAKEWLQSVSSQVDSARLLRARLRCAASPRMPKAKTLEMKALVSMERSLEDRMKGRSTTEKTLAASLAQRDDGMSKTGYSCEMCLLRMQKASAAAWTGLTMTERRQELRARLPEREQVRDEMQDALEHEHAELKRVHARLSEKLSEAERCLEQVASARAQMLRRKLTLPYVRSSEPFEFLKAIKARENEIERKCLTFDDVAKECEGAMERASRRTTAAARSVMARLARAKKRLETEIQQNHCTIATAEAKVDKLRRKINRFYRTPENQELEGMGGMMGFSKSLSNAVNYQESMFSASSLQMLRAKIKAASYTGVSGRDLQTVFARFDRDGSGELDEDELRRVLRRTFKIPPSVVTDPEIGALFAILDADKSGAISADEVIEFLRGDQAEVAKCEEMYREMTEVLGQLQAHQAELVADYNGKVAAWQVGRSVESMTRVAALELDAPPPPLDSPDAADAAPAAVRRRRALEPRVAEKVRAKLKRAVDSSRGSLGIDEFFGQVDKDGSGLLDVLELHRVLRELLRIPEYAVSDSEVSSLFVTLDADKSGSIDIREFAAFLDAPASGDVGAWASATAPVSGRTTTTGTPGPRPGTSPQVGTRSSRGSPLGAPGAPRPGTSLGAVRCAPLLSRAELERARRALQEAVQEHAPGQDAMELLGGAGAELEDEDLLRLFRRVLRVPSTALSDDDAVGLRASLDEEMTGRLSVTKLVEFIDLGD